MSKRLATVWKARKHVTTERAREFAAIALSRKIGYLQIENLPGTNIFESLPSRSFNPKQVIHCRDSLCLVKRGSVQINHRHNLLVKELKLGTLFGNMPLLGQTMLFTEALAGNEGAVIAFMNVDTAREWIKANPIAILEIIGSRLAKIEVEHYRAGFQLADSRIAALLLERAGEGSLIEGLTQEEAGKILGLYRETVNGIFKAIQSNHIIKVGKQEITILDKKTLQELAEL